MAIDLISCFYKKGEGRVSFLLSIAARTKRMIAAADDFLVFHDGRSSGTLWDIEQIKKAGKNYSYFKKDSLIDVDIDMSWDNIAEME